MTEVSKTIEVIIENNSSRKSYPKSITLGEIAEDQAIKLDYPVIGALVNNKLRELSYDLYKPKSIKFIDMSHPIGYRMYARSVAFVMYKAVKDIWHDGVLRIEHSVANGWFCGLELKGVNLTHEVAEMIEARMHEIVKEDIPFRRSEIPTSEAVALFRDLGLEEKASLFEYRTDHYSSVYHLNGLNNYFYGYLVPSTGLLSTFALEPYNHGLLLRLPVVGNPEVINKPLKQEKLFRIFREHKKWVNILGVPYVGNLNQAIATGNDSDLIKVAEALHEKKIARIADKIYKKGGVKLVLISGPSSSGKTTFSKRLGVQLTVLGYRVSTISLDDYFVNRELTPRDENGEYDFETIKAIDVTLFNDHLSQLIEGKEVTIPRFDFTTGQRNPNGHKLQLKKNGILVVEGIHGLNPELTSSIDESQKFGIFVSALTQIAIDSQNPIPTTDNRLIRRIVRDFRHRNYSALETIKRWPSVRKGEELYIFPYQENADVMFNSALFYELAVLKSYAEPVLREVQQNTPEYAEAYRLLKFISYFKNMSLKEVPPTSILREFLEGSSFIY